MRALIFASVLLVGCQVKPLKPTDVTETRVRPFHAVVEKSERPLEIEPLTVVLDTRSAFDYGLNHVVNSLHMPWENLAEKADTGEVLRDLHKASLRLSLAGLTPQTQVVIVGYGPNAGKGEEGRLAWNLLYLGFQDVQITAVEPMRKQMTQNASPPAQNVPQWKAEPREELQISKNEFLNLAMNPKLRLEKRVHIIDVRSEKEYLGKAAGKKVPDITAINIEWKHFFTSAGRPDAKFKARLAGLGIQPGDRVILISNRGVRSGAAAYALLALGFEHVQNFTGGWSSLLP